MLADPRSRTRARACRSRRPPRFLRLEAEAAVVEPQRLVAGDRVVEQADARTRCRAAAAAPASSTCSPSGPRVVEVRRVVARAAVHVDRERRLLLEQRCRSGRRRSSASARGPSGCWWKCRRGGLPLIDPSRRRKFMLVRSGPMPGCVMMSMNRPPAKWFSAANASRVMWIALIVDFGGRRPPSKLSTRMTASAAGDVLQLLRHLVGIVRQRLDLLARHRRAERRAAIRRRLARVARHRHRILQPLDGQHQRRACCRRPSAARPSGGASRSRGIPPGASSGRARARSPSRPLCRWS